MEACLVCCVCTRAKFIQYIKELGVASSLTYRGIVTFFFKVLPPNSPPPPLMVAGMFRWPTVISVSASQSKSSSVCYSSHRRWKTAVAALLGGGGGGRYAARGGSSGGRWTSLLVGTLVQLYIYEKLRWISYKCVYVCPYWMAIVTPLFEATDRPGVPTSSVLRRNSTERHNRTDTSMKSYDLYIYTSKIQRETSESFLWFCKKVTILETSRDNFGWKEINCDFEMSTNSLCGLWWGRLDWQW